MNEREGASRFGVVIAGGGVAALEAAFALRELAGTSVAITIATGASEFVYRPLAVVRPFQARPSYRLDLARITRDLDATLVSDDAASVDARELVLASSRRLQFDALLIAIGAGAEAVLTGGTLTPWDWGEGHAFRALLRSIENGEHRDIAFIVPGGLTWPLPLYELALLTSVFVTERKIAGIRLAVVTPERAPLQVFGSAASAAVADLLARRAITFEAGELAMAVEEGHVRTATGRRIPADAAVALPIIQARRLPGVAANDAGFIAIDPYCRVAGRSDVFAAGDCADQPVKQGGIAAQQADVAAAGIAALAGLPVTIGPVHPRLEAVLLTGGTPLHLDESGARPMELGNAASDRERREKLFARHLTAYLIRAAPPLPLLDERGSSDN
jgi:sulfide:quinone oxidoreductase